MNKSIAQNAELAILLLVKETIKIRTQVEINFYGPLTTFYASFLFFCFLPLALSALIMLNNLHTEIVLKG